MDSATVTAGEKRARMLEAEGEGKVANDCTGRREQ